MPEYSVWSSPECPLVVEYSAQVFEEIRQKAVDGLIALRRNGLGIGGLLLGEKAGGNKLRIHAFEEIECSHAMGPGFLLTAVEFANLRERLNHPTALSVLGLYITKPRGELDLSEQQQAMVSELFHHPDQVILVMRPGSLEPCRSVFYFHNQAGLVQAPEWELHPWRRDNVGNNQNDAADLPAYPVATALPAAAAPQKNEPVVQKNEPQRPASPAFVPVPITGKFKLSLVTPPMTVPLPDAIPEPKPTPIPTPIPTPMVVPPEPVPTPTTPVERFDFAPEPIKVKFDGVQVPPRVTAWSKFMAVMDENVFLRLRRNAKAILIWTFSILLLVAAGCGIYASRPLWVTPPQANLTATDNNGLLTFKWNPESAEFVDAGTLSILDDGRNKTIALTHEELTRGRLQYSRNSGRVSASLALDERRFIYLFEAPVAPVVRPVVPSR